MNITEAYYRTIRHYFKNFFQWLDEIRDWRDEKRIKYSVRDLIATGLLIFLLKLGSRNRFNEQRARGEFVANACELLSACGIAHGDSLNYFLKPLSGENLDGLRIKMVRTLIRNKVLDQFRVLGYFLVAFDGTGTIRFGEPHCPECLRQKLKNGQIIYHHPVLEAKLICWNGMVFSMGREFLRNEDGKKLQDCELKAFYRLSGKIKGDFPRLRICILGDGLYAGEPTFRLCKEYGWKYLIVLKDDDLSTVWEEVKGLRKLQQENQYCRLWRLPNGKKVKEEYRWTTDIEYHDQIVHVLEYEEEVAGEKPSRWGWITNIEVSEKNCAEVSSAGRLRWKIENEAFNTQKNGGYELEHVYSYNTQGQKNFYLLMQIAHLINQLVEKGSLLVSVYKGKVPSLKTITLDFLSEMKFLLLPWQVWRLEAETAFQIRFDTS